MDMTPTKEYLDDLQKRFKQIVDGEYEPMGPADLFVILKALNEAIDRWRLVAGLTLSELGEAVEQGPDAWPPILARVKMTPRDFARALGKAGRPAYERYAEFKGIYDAVVDAFDLDHGDLIQEAASDG